MTKTHALGAAWARLAPREQALARLAVALVALALLWWFLIAPPIKALRLSGERHAAVDAQWQQMQRLQAEVEQLRRAPRAPTGDAPALLRASAEEQLGAAARVTIASGRATVTLTDAPASAVAAWLAQVRAATQAAPIEAQLARAGSAQPARWSGTLVLALPNP